MSTAPMDSVFATRNRAIPWAPRGTAAFGCTPVGNGRVEGGVLVSRGKGLAAAIPADGE